MKAKELMIGDWVLDGNIYAQVTSITCDGNIETTHNEYSNIELVEPIPLTADILEKNGFEKIKIAYTFDKYRYHCTLKKERVFIDCIPYSNENLIVPNWFGVQVVENELDAQAHLNSSCTIPCAYVHELQHALRLCDIEKKIEL